MLVLSDLPNNSHNDKVQTANTGRPTMCRSCGSIVGSGQKECAVCGASVSVADAQTKRRGAVDNETVRFAKAVLDRPYKFTIALLVVNVFLFLVMMQTGDTPISLLAPLPNEVLVLFGAKMNYLVQTRHEWWRFVTPMFLHVNLLHLLVNMYSLWIVGPYVEKLYGSAKFIVFWVLTGIAGVVASYLSVRPNMSVGPVARFLFKATDDPSVGASGALFGLVGVLFVFGIKFRHELPEGFRRAFGTGLLPMILLNLFIGYMGSSFIDNAAHLGGLAAGAVLALVVDYRRPGEKSKIAITWQALQVAAIALVIVSFFKVSQHFRDPLPGFLVEQTQPAPVVDERTQKFLAYVKTLGDAQEAFLGALKYGDATQAESALKALASVPQLEPTADDLKEKLKALLTQAKNDVSVPKSSETPPAKDARKAQADRNALIADFVEWSKAYNVWLKTTGRQYGGLIEVTTTTTEPPAK